MKKDDLPKSPSTPSDDLMSSTTPQQWDTKYHFEALSSHFQKQQQAMSDKMDNMMSSKAKYEPPQRERGRPRAPHRCAARANPSRYSDADSLLNNIKMSIPEFEGLHDLDLCLDWECKVDKIFECYDFPELKKVQLASLEFIEAMQPLVHYERELEKKLNKIKQGMHSIEEYHKELETALNCVGKEDILDTTIIRYIKGTTSTPSPTPFSDSTRFQGHLGLPERHFDRSTPQSSQRLESTSMPPIKTPYTRPN
ncbi:hypothetical protein C2S53_000588 [Perilla frutescens var. hirtella]|uniref:Retrotransposon gag domain-containing protein n=1 Tax=Perilla frutescens var. hirtella TaxID=608512 RepID=A0AAD4IZQ5_PERFH|nr:hypothetical protein C2S53_000588 [Perilla frutescens var. hirtella]